MVQHTFVRFRRARRVSCCLYVGLWAALVTGATADASPEHARTRFYPSLVSEPMAPAIAPRTGPPPNMAVPSSQRALVHTMWQRSPTFRRQCDRIAAATRLVVTITLDPQSIPTLRGVTTLQESQGLWEAQVRLLDFGNLVEMLAHELEHVIERLDGVDIEAHARQTRSRAIRNGIGFETERAIEVGRQVAREVARWEE